MDPSDTTGLQVSGPRGLRRSRSESDPWTEGDNALYTASTGHNSPGPFGDLDVNNMNLADIFPDPSDCWPLTGTNLNLDKLPGYMLDDLSLEEQAEQNPPFHYPATNPGEGNTHSRYYASLSDSSVASAESIAASSAPNLKRRRRRARQTTSLRPSAPERKRYQCTFCTDGFKTRHDWKRHERTLHLSLDRWQCLRHGPTALEPDGTPSCVFCGHPSPSPSHLETHAFAACAARPAEDRVFFRKDHLVQHLRLVHNRCPFNERMARWVVAVDTVRSRCGFCDARMDSWAAREKHLAEHFKAGKDMREWAGDRGFDDHVEASVRDDMPAYLIAQERETMEPFSASRRSHRAVDEGATPEEQQLLDDGSTSGGAAVAGTPGIPPFGSLSGHSHRSVERVVLEYIAGEIRQGRVPTDEQIKTQLGIAMYGPEYDAWERTWADSQQWLEQLRKKAGLISLPLSQGKNAFVGLDKL